MWDAAIYVTINYPVRNVKIGTTLNANSGMNYYLSLPFQRGVMRLVGMIYNITTDYRMISSNAVPPKVEALRATDVELKARQAIARTAKMVLVWLMWKV
jgi:hypothetical protein